MATDQGGAHAAPGAQPNSGFCSKPGHGSFEETMWCTDCNVKFCIRCTSQHIGHQTMDAASAKFFRRTSSEPSEPPSTASITRSEFNDRMATFRRTSSASSEAASVLLRPFPQLCSRLCFGPD
jgi:hypothetical protein